MKTKAILRQTGADLLELLGSMRFAVSLLTFICVASIIGTVLQQNQASTTYIDKFGPFWYDVFDAFAIWHIYNSWWFLLIMAFLVISTSICVLRNAPKMIKDARSFREYVRTSSLRAFPNKVEQSTSTSPVESRQFMEGWLRSNGYRFKVREDENGVLLAAKKGAANRLGYIFAHVAIVVICVGGLLDSELPVRLQVWFAGKEPITQNMLISQVPESGRMALGNPSFRANMLLPEGSQSSHGILNVDEGVLVQPLPFSIKLNRFIVDYYSTGMPSSFKSDVEVTDPDTGKTFNQIIEVNEPLRYKGVTVYQSSFDDGGSSVKLKGFPLQGPEDRTFELDTRVGEPSRFDFSLGNNAPQSMSVNVTALRVINVEDLGTGEDPQPKAMLDHVAAVTGSAAASDKKNLKNLGPSVQYQIVGSDGQSREFTNYMLPVELDGSPVFLAGVRESAAQPFRYVRIPADSQGTVEEFMRLRSALERPEVLELATRRFAEKNTGLGMPVPTLQQASRGAMETFYRAGLNGLIERVPEHDREKVLEFAIPMIQFTLAEVRDIVRTQQGQPLVGQSDNPEADAEWLRLAVLALANLPDYPSPVFLTMDSFDHVQASVFQVSRSPGKNTVYLGSLFLIIGVFAMFYIRDRRIWVWIKPEGQGGTHLLAAMTSQRRTLDFNHEFERFKKAFSRLST